MDRTILVTGGAGYIGSHVVLALAEAGLEPVVLDDLSSGVRAAVPAGVALVEAGLAPVVLDDLSSGVRAAVPAGVPLVEGDVGDRALLDETMARFAPGAVMHFAGSISVPESVRLPLAYYRNNTMASLGLIEASLRHGVECFIFSSTAAVYGTPERQPVGEESPTAPINPYGTSKLMTETMLRDAAAAHGLRYVALRYFNAAGADPKGRVGQSTPGSQHLIKLACQTALGRRERLQVFGTDYPTRDGTCERDYIHVTDLAEAHLLALRHLQGGGESLVLNCGYGRGLTVREVIAAVEAAAGVSLPVALAPRRPGDPAALIAGSQRIRARLGWRPRHDDIAAIVGSALAWERRLAAPG